MKNPGQISPGFLLTKNFEYNKAMLLRTFKDLKDALANLTEEQLQTNLTILDVYIEEFYPLVTELGFADEDIDALEEGHPFLTINTDNTFGEWSLNLEKN